jgi:hypothetical protein
VAKAGGRLSSREMQTAKMGRMEYWQMKPSCISFRAKGVCNVSASLQSPGQASTAAPLAIARLFQAALF